MQLFGKQRLVFAFITIGSCILCYYFGATYMALQRLTPIQRAVFTANDRFFLALAFSSDGKLLAAGQQDGTITIWNIANGAEWFTVRGRDVATPDWSAAVQTLAFSSDGRMLASGGGECVVTLFEVDKKRMITQFPAQESAIESLVFSPDDKKVFTGTHNGVVRCWEVATGQPSVVFEAKRRPGGFRPWLRTIALDPLGKRLAVGVLRHSTLLDVQNGFRQIAESEVPNYNVVTLSFSRDSKLLAGAGQVVTLWDGMTGKQRAVLPVESGKMGSIAFSPTEDVLAIGIGTANLEPSHLSLWDTDKTRQLGSFACHNDVITRLAWSPDGKLLASASCDRTVRLWDVSMIVKELRRKEE